MLNGVTCLVVYYSRLPEVIHLRSITSLSVINALECIFARYHIPETLISKNRPQYMYSSSKFTQFVTYYLWASATIYPHYSQSSHYPQSYGLAERMAKTANKLLKEFDHEDLSLALFSYHMTPLPWCVAQLLQGRHLWSDKTEANNKTGHTSKSSSNRTK